MALARAPRSGGVNDDSVRGGDTNGCRSHLPWQNHSTNSSGALKYDKRVVEDAQHGAVRGLTTVDAPSLNVPALQMVEEVDADVLALLAFQEQAIVQELPAVPFSSSVTRAPAAH